MYDPADRLRGLELWLTGEVGLGDCRLTPASADASFRRYFRVQTADASYMAMDAPPEQEKPAAFLAIAQKLHALELSAPRIHAAAPERGYLLLEDLGDRTYTRALAEGADEGVLYALAVDTLIAPQ